jgi:TonB family protein
MNHLLPYLFEANMALLLFGAYYYAFLRKDTNFRFRRLYLLGMSAFSLILPLLHFNLSLYGENNDAVKNFQTLMLPEVVINGGTAAQTATETSASLEVIPMLYLTGMIILGAWFLFQIGQVLWFFISTRSRMEKRQDHILIMTNGTLPTFSFFRLLFLDNSIPLNEKEKECVIAHELAHIKQLHSIDIIFLELVKVMFWMNPVCWYFRNQIQELHEYLADEKITTQTNPDDYSHLLAKMALNKAHLSIGHHFHKSKTLKRIQMMKTTKTKMKNWKFMALVPVMALVLLVFSCNDEAMEDMQKVMETSTMSTNLSPEVQLKMDELQQKHPDAKFAYMETDMNNEAKVAELKEVDPNTIAWMNVDKEKERLGMIVQVNGTFKQISEATKDGDVFLVVEETALPPGGYPAFYKYIGDNLNYPQQAREMGIEGKVFIQFVVDTDGSLTEVTPVKGIGAGCDEEAVRVISQSPAWTPAQQRGKKVRQRIIVPIVFSLGGNASESIGAESVISVDDSMQIEITNHSDGIVQGKVTKSDGSPLAGVNVVVSNTQTGTVSDIDGTFKVRNTEGRDLVFSFIGYKTATLKVE